MPRKRFKLKTADIKPLAPGRGGCIASDRITVDGRPVGYMYRSRPDDPADSGWCFVAGDESRAYMDDPDRHGVYDVNTIANYDPEIIPFLDAPIGKAFERDAETDQFVEVDSPVDPDDCLHPDFPIVEGRHQLTDEWSITLPVKFNRRIEDGQLVLWRPGMTIWMTIWNNDHDESQAERLAWVRQEASPEAFEARERQDGHILRFDYCLSEDRDEGVVHSLSAFAIGADSLVQLAIYCDDDGDLQLARDMADSVTSR